MLFRFCLYGFLKNQRYFEPFLMLIFLDQGFSFFVIGMLVACRDLTVNILEIPSGALADSFGRRRAMMISFVAYIISFLILGSHGDPVWMFLGMFFYGVGDTFRSGTHKAMIFEWLRIQGRQKERTRIYGLTRSWSQIGSAVSGLIAAAFILITGNYQLVFYFAIVPYVLNLINFAGYPSQLDGTHEKSQTLRDSVSRLKTTLQKSVRRPRLRRLMIEAMGWEGFFAAIKDYLQPVLQLLAIAAVALLIGESTTDATQEPWLNDTRKSALLIGPIYAFLFLASAWASRKSHRFVERAGSQQAAAKRLWFINATLYVTLIVAALIEWPLLLMVGFVSLHVLKNVWRPILISRIDGLTEAHEGATVLSIESQAQRLSALLAAPAIGWAVDYFGTGIDQPALWPIGLLGAVIAIFMYMTAKKHDSLG